MSNSLPFEIIPDSGHARRTIAWLTDEALPLLDSVAMEFPFASNTMAKISTANAAYKTFFDLDDAVFHSPVKKPRVLATINEAAILTAHPTDVPSLPR